MKPKRPILVAGFRPAQMDMPAMKLDKPRPAGTDRPMPQSPLDQGDAP